MRRTLLAVVTLLLLAPSARATYTYYDTENLYTPTWSNWVVNNTMTPTWYSVGGYGGIGWGGIDGSMMTANGGGYGGEIAVTYRLDGTTNQANFDILLSAPSDMLSAGYGASDNGYILAVGLPGAGGTGGLGLSKAWHDGQGQLQLASLTSTNISAHDGMVIRAIVKPTGNNPNQYSPQIIVYVDNVVVLNYIDVGSLVGANCCMGVDVAFASGGNLMSQAALGHLDIIPPNAIPASSISTSATTNQINIQWPAGTDDTNGTGVWGYQLWRDGQLLTTTTGLSYVDTASIVPSTTYQYTLTVLDYHMNATNTAFSVTTPSVPTNGPFPSATPDGRRVGTRPTGAYWGGTNENIDVLSGNLNFTVPLLKAQGRNGWAVPFNLVYNSQNWRQDSGGEWLFDGDVGYGFGWKLLAGQITPVWNAGGFTAAYYLFTDSTGAEYRLDQNNGNIWSSKESVYIYFDANYNVLHFVDGSSWNFGCISAATEADSGVLHPTQMEDTNGNQILIRYQAAPGASWANSSARVTQIEDVRAVTQGPTIFATYQFSYNTDSIPHLTSIQNFIGTGEGYNFTYLGSEPIASPMNSQSFGTTTFLNTAVVTTLSMTYTFVYNGSGEMTKITLPYNGYLAYDYGTTSYASGISYREVTHRHLSKDGTLASELVYPVSHEPSPGSTVHQYTILDDPSGTGEKYWAFATTGLAEGLVTQYQGRQLPGPVAKTQNDFTWAQDSVGNSYIATTLTTLDPGQSYQVQKKSTQTVDVYGNVTQVQTYDFGNLSTPVRTNTYTYLLTTA